MKKYYLFLSVFASSFLSHAAFAQREITLPINDTLFLEVDSYNHGAIQWQSSTNKTDWTNIHSETANSLILRHRLSKAAYFRSEVQEEGCDIPYYTDTIQVNTRQYLPDPMLTNNKTYTSLNAGRAYIEPYTSSNPGISTSERSSLSSWTDTSKKAVWYLHQQTGVYELNLELNLTSNQTRHFKVTCSPAYEGLDFESVSNMFAYIGKGRRDTLQVLTVNVEKTGYYRYELECQNNAGSITIYNLLFAAIGKPSKAAASVAPHTTNYLSSPSVHLNFSTTGATSKSYDWIYSEIMVPSGGWAPLYTFWEALGYFAGYMGIQTNSATERRVLFSCWDATDTEQNPNAGKELLVTLVDKAPYTTANGFGGEGTGGQSYVGAGRADTWVEDQPVKFLMNIRQESCKTYTNNKNLLTLLVSAWYHAHNTEGWRYIATWRQPVLVNQPATTKEFAGFYAFIENFGWGTGQMPRKGYYYNSFGRESGLNTWTHFNKVRFSNTDGANGQRVDFEQGVAIEDPDKFYMLSGGYGLTKKTESQVSLITDFPALMNLDLMPFIKNIDDALVAEKERNNMVFIDKTK